MSSGMDWKMDSVLGFGKHQGKTIEEVIQEDKSYIKWMIEKFETDTFDEEIMDKVN